MINTETSEDSSSFVSIEQSIRGLYADTINSKQHEKIQIVTTEKWLRMMFVDSDQRQQ